MTASPPAPDRAAPEAARPPLLARLVYVVPDLLPVAVLAFGLVATVVLFFDGFRPLVVVPLGLVLSAALARSMPLVRHVDRGALLATAAAIVIATGWALVNVPYASEYVVVTRDPGFLTLEALWLDDYGSPEIPVGSAVTVDDAVEGAAAGSGAFSLHGDALNVQGTKMLPALLAIAGWWGPDRAVLAANLMLGAVGLLALFAAARRLVGPWWALLPMVTLAASLPYLNFTRAPYTEPLTMVFGLAALAVATSALRSGRVREFALAGAFAGATAAARIDGALVVIALVVALAVPCAATVDDEARGVRRRQFFAALTPALALVLLGYLDVRLQSPTYVADHAEEIYGLLGLTAAASIIGCALVLAPGLGRARRWIRRRRSALALAGVGGVLATAVLLASRPWWYVGRDIDPTSPVRYAVEGLQLGAGLPVDQLRSYDELTVSWLAWYFGAHVVALAALGLAAAAWAAARNRDPVQWLVLAMVTVGSAYYLVRVSITPDQIWAMRRLLPVAVPGMLLAATLALSRWAGRTRVRTVVAAGVAMTVAVYPVTSWDGLVTHVEHDGRYEQAAALCSALDRAEIEKVVWVHSSDFRYMPTIRVICDLETVEFLEPPRPDQLAAVAEVWADETVGVVTFNPDLVPWATTPGEPLDRRTTATMGRPLTERPHTVVWADIAVWAGTLRADGTVTGLGAGADL